MADTIEQLAVLLHLARASELRRRLHVRDRLLTLAAVHAAKDGLPRIAAYCRQRVLQHNPQHLIQRWSTIEQAARDAEFVHFLRHIERRYSAENAEQLFCNLGLDLAQERATYFTDEEYAAALLGLTLDQLYAATSETS